VASTLQAFCPDDLRHLGIAVQEYSVAERRLVGPRRLVFEGVKGVPEGAKMYRRNDWYYLMIAEGGTGYEHQVTMARSRSVWGPYTVHPDNPILTASGTDNPIQRAGHGDMVRVDDRAWAFVYLASRPVGHYSILGRETFIARGEWGADDWFRLDSRAPLTEVPDFGPATSDSGTGFQEARDEFDAPEPGLCWNSPRLPLGDRIDLRTRPSWLGLRGTPSCFHSLNRPTLLAQRVRHLSFRAETLMDFRPQQPGQWAGLICYYDTRRFFACCRLLDSRGRDTVTVLGRYGVTYGFDLATGVPLETNSSLVRLVVVGDGLRFRFGCATPGENEAIRWIDAEAECRFLSDEYAEETEPPDPIPTFGFTGTMVGLGCFDATGTADTAYFDYFDYQGDQDG
jgi:xylan 1,4-beta-xylosidase